MDQWARSLREDKSSRHGHGSIKNPSFSSTLLDAIYRSIDEGEEEGEEALVLYRETMKKKQSVGGNNTGISVNKEENDDEMASLRRRACMIDKWMMEEKKVCEKVVVRRKSSVPHFDRKVLLNDPSPMVFHSTSSSSDSSSGGGFSSSEAESVYGSRSRSSSFTSQRPKPVRTSVSGTRTENSAKILQFEHRRSSNVYDIRQSDRSSSVNPYHQQKQKHEGGGGFHKTKSRALKIYGDLKKVKQPISPGGRLANFLNSLFTAGNPKKAKMSTATTTRTTTTTATATSIRDGHEDMISSERKYKSAQASTCSSASSFSRSCLSKTPSSRGKSINGIKRSVSFYPVSVIVDEDSRPCGHKNLYEEEQQPRFMSLNDELKFHIMEKNRRVEEAARDLLKGYRESNINREIKCDIDMRDRDHHDDYRYQDDDDDDDEEEEEDDDAASYSSSDLFELDNLKSIGIERYREELPVYETTHLETNRAIANGFLL